MFAKSVLVVDLFLLTQEHGAEIGSTSSNEAALLTDLAKALKPLRFTIASH